MTFKETDIPSVSFLSPPVIPDLFGDLVIPGSTVSPGSPGDPLRQRLQHRALAASQPYTGKCALKLQPAAASPSSVILDLFGDPLRQRLQHRSLAASQPYTGKCALKLQPTAAGEGLFRSPFFVYFACKK